ncbi:hypothetical protein [Klebsiella pneumoniae]|uniref:hypothetical protein n=1 Tax=Klebsiella pneumoniae TaxID=573 RepID=UPI00264A176F|nr:hypothetical protein [Klebsiella pneumoniae]
MKKVVIFLATLALAGCVSNSERQKQQAEIDRTTPSCSSQKQCDAAWAAARQWVNQNCGMKIQNYSSDYIETYNSPAKEGANKQVISSQADSLIKISRIWADFFPANTSNQPI